ncbi:MAG: zinc-ribbon domain-containing protein [Clostridiales bacterium]|nr:zinc-ribbon domain-containing protein [Clostridiales bacterium]
MLCPKCGAQLSDSAVICRACGAMLPEHSLPQQQPYQPAQYPAGNAAQNTCSAPRTCAQCGAPLEDGMRFCTNCGAPVPERPDPAQSVPPRQDTAASCIPGICPHCGSRLNPGARFCTVCGTLAPEMPAAAPEWYGAAPGGAVSSPEIGAKRKPKKLLIGLLCGFAALVVIVAVLAGIFAARQAGEPSTAGGAEVDRLLERYFTNFENDDADAMLDLFLPEVITYMQDDDTVAGREDALIQLDDWYYDYGKAIDDYYVYDDDSLDASDVRDIQRELGVRIDDNVIVACDVTYQSGQDNEFYFEFVQVDGQWYLLFIVE